MLDGSVNDPLDESKVGVAEKDFVDGSLGLIVGKIEA
jgi:hypothetical protein